MGRWGHRKAPYCKRCRSADDHWTPDCPGNQICGFCGKRGHSYDECRARLKCTHCGKNYHTAEQCKAKLRCTACGGNYHTADQCRGRSSLGSGVGGGRGSLSLTREGANGNANGNGDGGGGIISGAMSETAARARPVPVSAENNPNTNNDATVSSKKKAKKSKKSGWDAMTVKELKAQCKKKGLNQGGRKADIIARLLENELGNDADDDAMAEAVHEFEMCREVSSANSANNSANSVGKSSVVPFDNSKMPVHSGAWDGTGASLSFPRAPVTVGGVSVCAPTRLSLSQNSQRTATSLISMSNATENINSTARKKLELTEEQKARIERKREEALRKKRARESGLAVAASSSSPSSAVNNGGAKKPGLTEEQKAQMARNREEALEKRKKVRMSAPSTLIAASNGARSALDMTKDKCNQGNSGELRELRMGPSSAGVESMSDPLLEATMSGKVGLKTEDTIDLGRSHRSHSPLRAKDPNQHAKPATNITNPYLIKSSAKFKRDERTREEDPMGKEEDPVDPNEEVVDRTMDDLPPLLDDAPPMRQEALDRLSEEKLAVVMAARPSNCTSASNLSCMDASGCNGSQNNPFPSKVEPHPMVRVNAAAGTGKTTTLLHLAARCIDLGHTSVTYLTFNRAQANDAQARIRATLEKEHRPCLTASTIHSCAYRLLKNEPLTGEEIEAQDERALGDHELRDLIKQKWGQRIDDFLREAYAQVRKTTADEEKSKIVRKEKLIFDKALYYLMKTFKNFTDKRMTLEQLEDRECKLRNYYPVQKDLNPGGAAEKLGFPTHIYMRDDKLSFYANVCVDIWKHLEKNGVRMFDVDVKKVQLKMMRIPGSVLLVDESQDLNDCQVAWISGQQALGAHVFIVGDSAQCIYYFRGAKSKYAMSLPCINTQLTRSWRFGPNIARIANVPLYAKEKSPQTSQKHGKGRMWIPYRVKGAGGDGEGGVVTTESLLTNRQKYKQIALIAATNHGLMVKAMDILGLGALKSTKDEDSTPSDESREETATENELRGVSTGNVGALPKFHFNGNGVTSGAGKWTKTIRQTRILYELSTNKDESGYHPMSLPAADFPAFANDGPITLPQLYEICHVRDITTYDVALSVIDTYKHNTLIALDAFESHALGKKCPQEEADIILSTVHSAKGLEWDHVEICGDILDLTAKPYVESKKLVTCHPPLLHETDDQVKSETPSLLGSSREEWRKSWEFDLLDYNDQNINMLYVACTRARKTLSVPTSMKMLLQDFDRLHFLLNAFKKDALGKSTDDTMVIMGNGKLNKGQVWNLYFDLVDPLRKELGIQHDCMMLPSIFPECKN